MEQDNIKMKVVIYTHYLKGGGAEKRASVYANYLFENGIDVVVVTMHKVEEEYNLNPKIQRYFVAESFGEYKTFSKKKRLQKLKEIFSIIQPDKVISFLTTYGLYSLLATRFNNKDKKLKKVECIYCVSLYQRKYGFQDRLIDFLCCLFSNKISLQCYEQIKCNRLFRKKCVVNYNPIHDRWANNDKDFSKLSIISIGRLTSQKNFELTIKAVSEVYKINNNISLDIFGNGKKINSLNKLINKLNAEEFIKIHPFSFNIDKEFESHNVFISSSRYEGFPNGLAEAMMAGLLCLSTPCSTGPKEMIEDGSTGLFFKGKNQLCKILLSIINKTERFSKIAKAARISTKDHFEDVKILPAFIDSIIK